MQKLDRNFNNFSSLLQAKDRSMKWVLWRKTSRENSGQPARDSGTGTTAKTNALRSLVEAERQKIHALEMFARLRIRLSRRCSAERFVTSTPGQARDDQANLRLVFPWPKSTSIVACRFIDLIQEAHGLSESRGEI